MTDLRTKIELAVAKANAPVPGSRVDSRWALDFLRALEAEGLKVLDGKATDAMIRKALPMYAAMIPDSEWPFSRNLFRAMFAAAPTLSNRLKEEK